MTMRITGLTSGMDIDSMISKLMKAEHIPVDKLLQKKQTLQWKKESYSSINLKLSSFRESISSSRFSGGWNKLDAAGDTVRLSEDEMVTKVKDILSKYNDLVSNLNGTLTEDVYRGYAPLTSDQKNDMKDSDIAAWESKAKSGLLRNDDIMKKAFNELRGLASAKVTGADSDYDTLSELGITTPQYMKNSPENGKLILDEAKLRKAIKDNPDSVVQAFTAQSATDNTAKGFIQRAFEIVDTAMISVSRKISGGMNTAESLNSQIGKIETKVTEWNAKLNKKEDRYYKMFSAMEKAIANGNAQSSWLAQQFQ
ncbi:flagellar filament capping protein FliD [Cohnella mopanensis]|uniref:flagellar filament capping protein FliD n=1 Tax=Cohnella mopanensis TaxID=2911966 RepID=UPI001EF99D14|nr:flagellar filament capping protein FliD [Cohnella mopanensis]